MLPLRKVFAPRERSIKLEEIAQWEALWFDSPNIAWAVKIKEAEVGGTCGKHRGEEKWLRTFGRIIKKPLARPKFRLEDNIQMDLKKHDECVRIWFVWLRRGAICRLLWTQWRTFGINKTWGIVWVAEEILSPREGLCGKEVIYSNFFKICQGLCFFFPRIA